MHQVPTSSDEFRYRLGTIRLDVFLVTPLDSLTQAVDRALILHSSGGLVAPLIA